ncbi:MAG: hypothetical protein ABF586_04195 [Sporolactobacillus sp.]
MKTFIFCREDSDQRVVLLHPCTFLRAGSLHMAVQVFALQNKMTLRATWSVGKNALGIQLTKRCWLRSNKSFVFIVIRKKEADRRLANWQTGNKKMGS